MTKTNYTYTDPRAVAYMMKEFGVKFITVDGRNISLRYENHLENGVCCIAVKSDENQCGHDINYYSYEHAAKAYVHPESIEVFKVLPGDMVDTIRSEGERVIVHLPKARLSDSCLPTEGSYKIIQRGGKPFFWPVIELQDDVSVPKSGVIYCTKHKKDMDVFSFEISADKKVDFCAECLFYALRELSVNLGR